MAGSAQGASGLDVARAMMNHVMRSVALGGGRDGTPPPSGRAWPGVQ
ncbi:MAG TPA: hypothetical protein VGV60_18135 [Candidatus Polarisedimenticolia bacterium]|nr:hypothetical protein [Candidatus Polarisedimenticolia bacterium]